MKYLVSFLLITAFTCFSNAQGGTIVGFNISPTYPSNTDTIYIYADLQFTSGDCNLDTKSHSLSGTTIVASAHHCLGALTVICTALDTFKINPLPNGNYSFDLGLTTGTAPAPCTPGFSIDDDSTFNFVVGTVGLVNDDEASLIVYPNPVQHQLYLSSVQDGTVYKLTTVTGQVVKKGLVNSKVIDNLDVLPSGIYFLQLNMQNGVVIKQIAKD